MIIFLKLFPIIALIVKTNDCVLVGHKLNCYKELNYFLLFVYIESENNIYLLSNKDLRVSIDVCWKFGKSVSRSLCVCLCDVVCDANVCRFKQILCVRARRQLVSVEQPCRQDEPVASINHKRLSNNGNRNRAAMLTNEQVPLDQRVRPVVGWQAMRVQQHREGVMLVDQMRIFMMRAVDNTKQQKCDDLLIRFDLEWISLVSLSVVECQQHCAMLVDTMRV